MSDLRARFRRSFFGILWTIIQPVGLTLLIALVFSKLFKENVTEYAPYILSGIIIWDYVCVSAVGGAVAFLQADAYIKQVRHPLAIYSLRTAITGLIVMAIGGSALLVWVLVVMPQNFGWAWIAVLSIFPIILLIAWPLATIMAYIGVRFRDLPNALGLLLQAAWFVSPVYFKDSMFRNGGLHGLIDYNPIHHLLQIVRAPLLRGEWPTSANYLWCLGTILVLTVLAVLIGRRSEKNVILYL